jgi:hypothetical protein
MSASREVKSRSTTDADDSLLNLRFDYDSVPSSLASFLRGQADRIRRQCVTSIIQIGKALLEAKRHLSHGAFLRWIEWEVRMPVRTAQAYMRVALWASSKSAIVAHLSPTMLYLLSAPSTPEDFVSSVLSRMEAGELVAPSIMRKELKDLLSSRRMDDRSESEPITVQTPATIRLEDAEVASNFSGGLSELVEILIKGLSAADFERARQIVTSYAVLYDPELPQNLERAFMSRADEGPSEGTSGESATLLMSD